jgi:serralysin
MPAPYPGPDDRVASMIMAPGPGSAIKPVENGSGGTTVTVGPTFEQRIDGLLVGVKWAGSFITYSDPDRVSDYEADHPEFLSDFERISADQLAAVHATLDGLVRTQPAGVGFSVEGFTKLGIDYAGGGSGTGTIRLANTSDPPTAWAYYPSDGVWGGDVFLGSSGQLPTPGNYDYYTIIHELGHSLGLKHGHETGAFGALPFKTDSMEYSVMTYRSFVGSDAQSVYNEQWGYAQTFMMYDIAALQHMYGADYETNAGDTVYSWSPTSGSTYVNGALAIAPGGNRIFQTIWDGGGADTYDLSNYSTNLTIDLSPGGHSTFSTEQLAALGGGPNNGYARGNVFNALLHSGNPASLIESALGGSGSDTIIGNAAGNSLVGNAGHDTLRGGDGFDLLDGGDGRDLLHGDKGNDTLRGGNGFDVLNGGPGHDLMYGEIGRDTLRGGDGRDVLDGGTGDDVIQGGPGADTLVFGTAYGANTVLDFEVGLDMILLDGISLRRATRADLDGDREPDTLLRFSDGSAKLLDVDIAARIANDPDAIFFA